MGLMRRLSSSLTAAALSLAIVTPLAHASLVIVGDRGQERAVDSADIKAATPEAPATKLPEAFQTVKTATPTPEATAAFPVTETRSAVIDGAYTPPPPIIPCEVAPGTLADNLDSLSKTFNGKPVVWLPPFDVQISVKARIDASNYQECVSNVIVSMQREGAPIRASEKENVILISER